MDVLEFKVNEDTTEGSSSMVAKKIAVKPDTNSNTAESPAVEANDEKKPIEPLPTAAPKEDVDDGGDKAKLILDKVATTAAEDTSKLLKDLPDESPASSTTATESESNVEVTTPPTITTPNQESTTEKLQGSKSKQSQPPIVAVGGSSGLPGSKESIVVKLTAKIKALEENLTMSMMYLEEMSEKCVYFFFCIFANIYN